jgi:hypothetical protein
MQEIFVPLARATAPPNPHHNPDEAVVLVQVLVRGGEAVVVGPGGDQKGADA